MSPRTVSACRVALAGAVVLAALALAGSAAGQSGATVGIEDITPEAAQTDEIVTVEYTANGSGVSDGDVTLVFEHPRGDEVTVDGQAGEGISQDIDLDSYELDPGPYDLRVEIAGGPTAERGEALEVAPAYDPNDASFETTVSTIDDAGPTYEGVAGDFVTVSVDLGELDEGYVVVGGDRSEDGSRSEAPLDVVHVDGSATFLLNTRLVGTDRPSEKVYVPLDGEVTSYAQELGPDEPPSGVFEGLRFETEDYEQEFDNLTAYREASTRGQQVRPLQPDADVGMVVGGPDSLVVTDDGEPDARFPLDRAELSLTEPELEGVQTYRLPTGNADARAFAADPDNAEELEPGDIDALLEDATETDTLARTDRLLIEVEATGIYGALAASLGVGDPTEADEAALVDPADFGAFLELPEGIAVGSSYQAPAPNLPDESIDLFDTQAHATTVVVDPAFEDEPTETDRFYVVVDTRELDAPDSDDEAVDYTVEMRYAPPPEERYRFATGQAGGPPAPFDPAPQGSGDTEFFPYLLPGDPTPEQTAGFTVEERVVEFDRTTPDGELVVPATSDASISGTTNLAPGTNLPVEIVVDARDDLTIERDDLRELDIDDEGRFSVSTDLSMVDPGAEVDIGFEAYRERLDERPAVVVDEDDVGGNFSVTELSAESIVTVQGTFVEMGAEITNTGPLPDSRSVELLLDGEEVASRTLELEPGESRLLNFDDALTDIEPGEYPLEVQTPEDREGLLLVVDEAEGVFEVTDFEANATVTDGEPDLDLAATVRNTGTINETAPVELLSDGEVIAERTADLLSGQDVTYSFAEELAALGPGNHSLTLRTPDDEQQLELTVEAPEATFEVTAIDVATTVEHGETLAPAAVVNNTGTAAGSDTVTVAFDGDALDESELELLPGENERLAFAETTVDADPGTYTLRVETPDDAETVEVVVEGEAGEDEAGSEETGGEGEDDDGPGGLFAVGLGRGAVVAGTATVAGVYVLGHWA